MECDLKRLSSISKDFPLAVLKLRVSFQNVAPLYAVIWCTFSVMRSLLIKSVLLPRLLCAPATHWSVRLGLMTEDEGLYPAQSVELPRLHYVVIMTGGLLPSYSLSRFICIGKKIIKKTDPGETGTTSCYYSTSTAMSLSLCSTAAFSSAHHTLSEPLPAVSQGAQTTKANFICVYHSLNTSSLNLHGSRTWEESPRRDALGRGVAGGRHRRGTAPRLCF